MTVQGRTIREALTVGEKNVSELPGHRWDWVPLRWLVQGDRPITYGIVQCGPNQDSGVPYIRPVDMQEEGGLAADELQRTTEEIAEQYERSSLVSGDLVVSIGPSFGKVMEVPPELEGANLTQGTARVSPGRLVEKGFLFWALRSPEAQAFWNAECSGATFRALTLEILRNTPIPLPHLETQQSIASFLDRETSRIDKLIDRKKRLLELLDEKRTALITQAVTKGLDPDVPMEESGVEWLGEIPEHWDIVYLDRLVQSTRPITYGIVQPGDRDPDGIPMVRGQDYSNGWATLESIFHVSIDVERSYRRARIRPGDLLMTIVGAGTGNVAVVPEWLKFANITQTTARIAIDRVRASSEFIRCVLESRVGQANVDLAVKGAAQPGLNLGHLAKFRIPLPPKDEQQEISEKVESRTASFDSLQNRVRSAISLLQEYRTALISAAVTGKIDVRDHAA